MEADQRLTVEDFCLNLTTGQFVGDHPVLDRSRRDVGCE